MSGIISTDGAITRVIGRVNAVSAGTQQLANSVSNLIHGRPQANLYAGMIGSAPPDSWLAQLYPASFRGIPFAVDGQGGARGRRTALHRYPKRDDVWPEDMGRSERVHSISGYVVGDDCFDQAQAILDAAETEGPGLLVHPWLGPIQVSCMGPVQHQMRPDRGNVVEFQFSFVEYGSPVYPDAGDDTQGAVDDAADDAEDACTADFSDRVAEAVDKGSAVIKAGVRTVAAFSSQVQMVVSDASMVAHAVAGLPAAAGTTFGRYADGGRGTLLTGVSTVEGAIHAVGQARAAVTAAANTAANLAGAL